MGQEALMRRACHHSLQSLAAALAEHAGRQIPSRDPEAATQEMWGRQQEPEKQESFCQEKEGDKATARYNGNPLQLGKREENN
jgi:hypothetical protein